MKTSTANYRYNSINSRNSVDWKLLLTVAALCNSALSSFVSGIFFHVPGLSLISSYIFPFFIGLCIIFNLNKISHYIKSADIIGLLVFISVVLVSYMLYPADQEYITQNVPGMLCQALPYYFLGIYMDTDAGTFRWIYRAAIFSIIIHVLYFTYFCILRGVYFNYSMTWAYGILPHVMICFWYYFKDKSIWSLAFGLLGTIYLLFLGTRGPAVVLAVYIAVLCLKYTKSKKRIILVAAIALVVYLFFFTDVPIKLAAILAGYAEKYGFSIRIFSFITQGNMFSDTSGRDQIYNTVIEKIGERPLLGYGIYGEWQFIQNPSHRIWLEIWMHYGILLGSLLIMAWLHIVYRGYKCSVNDDAGNFILLWTVHIATRGIFGATYLGYYSFLLLGLCIGQIRRARLTAKSVTDKS